MKKFFVFSIFALAVFGQAFSQGHIEYKWRGFYSVVDFSFVANLNRGESQAPAVAPATAISEGYSVNALGVSVIGGFQFRREICVGIGATYLMDMSGAFSQVPLFVELRSNILRSRITPYTAIQLGYSLPVGTEGGSPVVTKITEGGPYFGLEVGARYAISRKFAVGGHIGYKMLQSNEVTRHDTSNPGTAPEIAEAVTLHMFAFGASLHF